MIYGTNLRNKIDLARFMVRSLTAIYVIVSSSFINPLRMI